MKSAHLFRSHKSLRLSRASSRRLITIETRQRSIRFLFLQERVKRDIINYAEMHCPRERVRERSTKSNGRKSSDSCQPVRFVSKKKVHHQEETNKKRNVKWNEIRILLLRRITSSRRCLTKTCPSGLPRLPIQRLSPGSVSPVRRSNLYDW